MREPFEWDSRKALANLAKHGVSFEEAQDAVEDPFGIVKHDSRDADEDRFQVIGESGRERIPMVVTVDRGAKIRIVSARKATQSERRTYENQGQITD